MSADRETCPRRRAAHLRPPGARLLAAAGALVVFCAVSLSAQDLERGRDVFLSRCAKCHGENGVPRRIARGAPNFTDPGWSIPLEQIEETVRQGKGEDMPQFKSKLDLEQIKSVASFVQTINKGSLARPDRNGEARK